MASSSPSAPTSEALLGSTLAGMMFKCSLMLHNVTRNDSFEDALERVAPGWKLWLRHGPCRGTKRARIDDHIRLCRDRLLGYEGPFTMTAYQARLTLARSPARGLIRALGWTIDNPKTFFQAARRYAKPRLHRYNPQSALPPRRDNYIYPLSRDIDTLRSWEPWPPRELRVQDGSIEVLSPQKGDKPENWSTVSPRWLRDHCMCSSCFNQATGQRQINVLKGDVNCDVLDIVDGKETIAITFKDGHKTNISRRLVAERSPWQLRARHGIIESQTWNASIACDPPSVQHRECEDQGLGRLLKNIRIHGFCFVEGSPPTPEATQSLLEAIGPIRTTHYGGFYDFTSNLQSKDTAYTSESLEPHTDNTYFTEPAGLQALHLLSHTDGSGGESSLVDGFGAASKLFKQDRDAYMRLSHTTVYGHASGNEGISIQPAEAHPVLTHHSQIGSLMQVRWNNADRAGVFGGMQSIDEWYNAASKFDALLNDPKNVYEFQLEPGKILIFDNWRVLHGRAAFTGKRRMCGGYINRDDFISKFRQTNMSPEEIQATTVTG